MKHILIIDDDKINLDCARMTLSKTYKITATISGQQALQFLAANIPDLILLDLNMPFMDGIEVMNRLKADPRTADIPVVFLSAEKDAVTEGRCLEVGAVDFMPKPFVPSVLLSRLEKIFNNLDQQNELKDKLNEIKDKSQRDVLTGLWNRAYVAGIVDEKLREGVQGSLFMIDMDNFKAINDNYGHDSGDKILKMFADTLRAYSEEEDIPARIGGDEFVIWVPGVTDKEALGARAGDIIRDLCRKLADCRFETNSSVSLGIAISPVDGEDFTDLYNAADKALYYVKQNGKNSYHFYSDSSGLGNKENISNLDYLHELLKKSDAKSGAYNLDLHGFTYIYNFLSRLSERDVYISMVFLINMIPEEGYTPKDDDNSRAVEMLDQALSSCLRRGDVTARYSPTQVLLLLPGINEGEAVIISERIRVEYESRLPGGKIKLKILRKKVHE